MNIRILILCYTMAFLITLGLTPAAKSLAYKIGAIDVPKDKRRVHKRPIPRLGGLAIYYGFLVSILLFSDIDRQLISIIAGSLLIVGVGIIDDVKQLRAGIKLVVQIVAALIVAFGGVRITALSMPSMIVPGGIISLGVLSLPITVLWIVGVTNAVNLIDGLDGLAAGICSIATFSLFFIAILAGEISVAVLAAALAGSCMGFLPYNFNPAKIFMGDTGSTFLGYMLSIICIQGLFKGYVIISFIVPFLILGLPIFDTTYAILRRIKNKKPIMSPDRGHLHHRLIDMGLSQKQTVAILYVIAMILGLSAVMVVGQGAFAATIFIACVMLFVFFGGKMIIERQVAIHKEAIDAEKHEKQEKQEKSDPEEKNFTENGQEDTMSGDFKEIKKLKRTDITEDDDND